MRKKINIILYLGALLIGTTLGVSGQDARSMTPVPNVPYGMNAATLNGQKLEGFSLRAEQKIVDFFNYVEIVSNRDYDSTLRAHSAELAQAMFVAPKTKITINYAGDKETNAFSSPEYFEHIQLAKTSHLSFALDQIKWLEPLSQNGPGHTYSGKLSFQLHTEHFFANEDDELKTSDTYHCFIYLERAIKAFGRDRIQVWEVKLGRLYVVKG